MIKFPFCEVKRKKSSLVIQGNFGHRMWDELRLLHNEVLHFCQGRHFVDYRKKSIVCYTSTPQHLAVVRIDDYWLKGATTRITGCKWSVAELTVHVNAMVGHF